MDRDEQEVDRGDDQGLLLLLRASIPHWLCDSHPPDLAPGLQSTAANSGGIGQSPRRDSHTPHPVRGRSQTLVGRGDVELFHKRPSWWRTELQKRGVKCGERAAPWFFQGPSFISSTRSNSPDRSDVDGILI